MDEIKEGSLVRAVKGSNVIEGVVTAARFIGDTQWQLGDARSCGYEVTVLEEPAVLPTEPGDYLDKDRDWWRIGPGDGLSAAFAPYTRIEPVPATVQRVINYLIASGTVHANGEVVRALHKFGAVR